MTRPDPTETPFPNLDAALARSRAAVKGEISVCGIGRVDSYDASTGTVQVRLIVPLTVANGDGALELEQVEPLGEVPVLFPGAGGVRLTWPIEPGDLGVVFIRDRSHDEVDAGQTNPDSADLRSDRRFSFQDALFAPTYVPPATGLGSNETSTQGLVVNIEAGQKVFIGDATANEALALATLVKRELDTIDATWSNHTHSVTTTVSNATPAAPGPVTGAGTTGPAAKYTPSAVDSKRIFTDDTT